MNTSTIDDASGLAQRNATLLEDEIQYGVDYELLRKLGALLRWYAHIEIVLAVLAIVFTSIVLLVIASRRSFHNVTHSFIANLMVSDFGMAICCIWDGSHWLTRSYDNIISCGGLNKYLQHVAFQISCSTLILLTLTRYDAILNPLQSLNRWSKGRITSAICLSWFLSFLLQIPSYYLVCNPTTPLEIIHQIYIYSIMFFVPSLLLIFCYARIVHRVMRDTFRNKHLSVSSKYDATRKGRTAQQAKLTQMVVMILLVFFLFRAPRSTFVLYKFLVGWSGTYWFRDLILLFAFILLEQLSCVVDPFIYAFCAPQFRGYLAEKVRCRP